MLVVLTRPLGTPPPSSGGGRATGRVGNHGRHEMCKFCGDLAADYYRMGYAAGAFGDARHRSEEDEAMPRSQLKRPYDDSVDCTHCYTTGIDPAAKRCPRCGTSLDGDGGEPWSDVTNNSQADTAVQPQGTGGRGQHQVYVWAPPGYERFIDE
jgi:hypothetical protein